AGRARLGARRGSNPDRGAWLAGSCPERMARRTLSRALSALHRARRPMARLFRKRATMRTGPVFRAAAALYQERSAMSASAQPPASPARFSTQELDMLARTADALSAYLGKPVLAEVMQGDEG